MNPISRRMFFRRAPAALAAPALVGTTEPKKISPVPAEAPDATPAYPVGSLIEYAPGLKGIVVEIAHSNPTIPPGYCIDRIDKPPVEWNYLGHLKFHKTKVAWWKASEWHAVLRVGPV